MRSMVCAVLTPCLCFASLVRYSNWLGALNLLCGLGGLQYLPAYKNLFFQI